MPDLTGTHSDYAAITEGSCPYGHGPLESRESYGWCEQCHRGWSLDGDKATMHLKRRDPT